MDQRLTVPVYYDFASTICYVAHRVIGRIATELERLDVDLVWRPIDMIGITGWQRGMVVDGPRRENALRVARELGVAARMPGAWIDSRRAACVAAGLSDRAREATWRERVWSAVFEEGRDVGAAGEVERLGRDCGIEVAPWLGDEALERLEQATRTARATEVTGVPTFDLGFPLGGIQEASTMLDLLRRYAENRRRRGDGGDRP